MIHQEKQRCLKRKKGRRSGGGFQIFIPQPRCVTGTLPWDPTLCASSYTASRFRVVLWIFPDACGITIVGLWPSFRRRNGRRIVVASFSARETTRTFAPPHTCPHKNCWEHLPFSAYRGTSAMVIFGGRCPGRGQMSGQPGYNVQPTQTTHRPRPISPLIVYI